MKQLSLFLIVNILCFQFLGLSFCLNSTLEEFKMKLKNEYRNRLIKKFLTSNKNKSQISSQLAPLWEGWIKYFHYIGNPERKPTNFFINQEFFQQKVLKTQRLEQDTKGFRYIPTKFHFFAKLLTMQLTLLSSREFAGGRGVDNLNIELIMPVNPDDPYNSKKSSIRDLGNFKEGFCIGITTTVPKLPNEKFSVYIKDDVKNGNTESWILCFDNEKDKNAIMGTLVKIKLDIQKQENIRYEDQRAARSENSPTKLAEVINPKPTPRYERYNGPGASLKDGYLLLLNDWTKCSLKCGGGQRFQQWMCVPPKKGGRPCQGKLIRTMPCNTQPCPGTIFQTPKKKGEPQPIVLPPIIKSLPVSARPQQNIPCEIRESDVLYSNMIGTGGKYINTPARLVINKRMISLFNDDSYTDAIFNFDLKKAELVPIENEYCCFKIKSENKSYRICAFGTECGSKTNPKFYRDYNYSFNLFKKKCYDTFDSEKAANSVGKLPNKNNAHDNYLQMDLADEVVKEREKFLLKQYSNKVEDSLVKKIADTQKVALKAIKKELSFQEMIKREELLKAQEETTELVKLMKYEERKKQRLEQALKEREFEEQRLRETKEINKEIANIQIDAKKEVEKKREELKESINEIRKKALRRKKKIEHQISVIRGQMAKDLVQANKEGNIQTCRNASSSKDLLIKYCNANIVDDLAKNTECKLPESFCYLCCENEFGEMFITKRDECYNMCDLLVPNVGSDKKQNGPIPPPLNWKPI